MRMEGNKTEKKEKKIIQNDREKSKKRKIKNTKV